MSGCSAFIQQGDYVTYTSDKYTFIANTFLNQSIDCLELGSIDESDIEAKYCVGVNYASKLVEGFMFEHTYRNDQERFIGATLSFKAKEKFTIECNSETVDGQSSGTEYVNCMVPKQNFDLYFFLMSSPMDVYGTFKAAVGVDNVYQGVIGVEDKERLGQFYKDIAADTKEDWKRGKL